MKRLIVALALVASLGMAGHALAMDKKINIFNGAQYDIYTLYLSPTNANDWEENLLKQETLPNGDKVDVEVSRTEKAEAWDVKVTNKAAELSRIADFLSDYRNQTDGRGFLVDHTDGRLICDNA